MKIIHQTTTQLILRQPLIGVRLLGSFMALLGLFLFIGYEAPVDWLGGSCVAIAGLILSAPTETFTFDKQAQQVILQRKRGLNSRVKCFPLQQIDQIRVDQSTLGGTRFYSLNLWMASGQRLALTKFPSTDVDLACTIASRIRRFLKSNPYT
uniref:DUF304 domain-containing protein n=1 Tax=Cyanothece sp. (strain PCC 7425 / ATCC 29141) TaxID=395961 RepID=B8HVX1_CYAP4